MAHVAKPIPHFSQLQHGLSFACDCGVRTRVCGVDTQANTVFPRSPSVEMSGTDPQTGSLDAAGKSAHATLSPYRVRNVDYVWPEVVGQAILPAAGFQPASPAEVKGQPAGR